MDTTGCNVCVLASFEFRVLQRVRGAVNGLMGELLEGHLREHLAHSDDRGRTDALDEVVSVLRTYLK